MKQLVYVITWLLTSKQLFTAAKIHRKFSMYQIWCNFGKSDGKAERQK